MEANVYLQKAENSLMAAELCLTNDLYDDCAHRSYYAALRASIAALLNIGLSVGDRRRIHQWVQANFPRECVWQRKIYPAYIVSYISDLRSSRETADYSTDFITQKTAKRNCDKARKFLEWIRKELKE